MDLILRTDFFYKNFLKKKEVCKTITLAPSASSSPNKNM